ncbi:solute carrier family 22 member 14 isoform X2 [Hyaena hyaena]|uniref:solute carrier family 22 member 14 isoform X2 n=1 Tax=Hyaena hyaena TaxID=95912 RepID=UPI0019247E80|nr:solute carrier family 22 member 14 isoform X2 [Hyaena hyaena]
MLRESSCRVKHRPPHLPKELNKPTARERSDSWSLERLLRRLRAMEANQDDKLARVLRALGEFGAFQRRLVVLILIPNILLAFLTFADFFVFTAQRPYCNTSWILAVGPNLTEAEQMNLTLPRGPDGSFQTCLMYLPVAWDLDSIIRFGLNYTKSCQDGWIYPDTKKRSLINEVWLVLSCLQLPHRPRDVPLTEQFDLVCGKEQNSESVQTILTAGLLIGSLLFGLISDKLGRCPTLLVSLLGLMVFGFGTAFVNTFNQYLFFRFGVSQALVGYTISSVSLATEWLLTEHRAHAVILEHCFFSVGVLLLTGLAYSLPHWRLLFLLGGAPAFPLISYIWALPESPRWLLMKGRLEDAKRALCHAADVNKTTLPLSLLDKLQLPRKKKAKASILDFCGNRHLRKVTLVMGCVWFAVGYSYFTVCLKLKDFGMNVHLRYVIPGIVEVPARLCCVFLLEHVGRKWSLLATLFQGSLMCLLALTLPSELKSIMVLVIALGEFSLAASASVFFIYTAELLPTVLRATGLGLVSLAWAAGAVLSLMIINQTPTVLPTLVCCVSAVLALFLCSLLPETEEEPLPDMLEHYPLQTSFFRNMTEKLVTEEAAFKDGTDDVVKNTILNSMTLNLDSDTSLQDGAEDTRDG